MVGFGFMDQFVLIQAGGYIDATLGVQLGLATLSAAAAGTFGTLYVVVHKSYSLSLSNPRLTAFLS